MTKSWISVTVLFFLTITCCYPATYYLSNGGNDSFPGTRQDSAWKTITKLNTVTLFPGDSVLFRTGDTFRGQINLTESGLNGQIIYFGSYGNLSHPVISGAEPISGWALLPNNIYSADFTKEASNFFVNGKMMTFARYPNSGFLTIDSSGVNSGLYDAALSQADNYWKGARLKVRSTDNKYEQTGIDSSGPGWLKFVTPVSTNLSAGYGYYLDHQFTELDSVNEWYYDTAAHKIYFYSVTDPETSTTEASVYDFGIYGNNNSFLKVEGIDFEKQVRDGARFDGTSSHIRFDSCNFHFCLLNAIYFNVTSNDTIQQCSFKKIFGDALSLGQLGSSLITNNYFRDIGNQPGYGLDGVTEHDAIRFTGNQNIISLNQIDTIGLAAIIFTGGNNLIEKNLIKNSMYTMNGGSAIFTYGNDSSNSLIRDNFIFNTKGNNTATPSNKLYSNGILINNSSELRLEHNTIVNTTSYGIYISEGNKKHVIKNNLIYNSGISQIYFLSFDTIKRNADNNITGNIFYSLNDNQYPMLLDGDSLFRPGRCDSNYYCNPYDFYSVYQYPHGKYYNIKPYSLDDWKSMYGDDLNSKESLVKFKSFFVADTVGNNLVQNGDFTNNFDGWGTQPETNNQLLLDNFTGLDGGCVKLKMLSDTPFVWGQFYSGNFSIQDSYLYQVNFSAKALKRINLFSNIKGSVAPYLVSRYSKFYPIDTNRTDYNYIFKASESLTPANLTFEIRFPDSLIWLDNIHLFQVNGTYNDSSKLSRLLTNYSSVTKDISLGDSVYRDLDGKLIKGSYSLAPFSSYVLTLDSPFINTTIKEGFTEAELTFFPNPISPSQQLLHYSINDHTNSSYKLKIIDLFGKIVFDKNIYLNPGEIKISEIPSGFYIIKLSNIRRTYEKKLLIIN